ncbi:MAG: hypothetical protein JWP89_4580 [Schlesneria sp.]|nr:hypothetical protein [Schlesneria sp.]
MPLPTKEEINPFEDDLDGISACRNFLGKTLDDVEAMLNENSGLYQEDLLYLGPVAFRYYLPAIARFFQNHRAVQRSFVDWFAVVLESRLENERGELAPVAGQLVEVCRVIDESWPDPEYLEHYRDVQKKYVKLTNEFLRMVAER